MLKKIIKRSGEEVPFDASKIRNAIFKANVRNAEEKFSDEELDRLTAAVVARLEAAKKIPTVEQTQDICLVRIHAFAPRRDPLRTVRGGPAVISPGPGIHRFRFL